jgi:hypothetical protein
MELLDVQKMRVVNLADEAEAGEAVCEILVVGGGMGGASAALAAARSGRRVLLVEETDWLGGQMTSQGVSALDEHRWIESFGGTRSYMELRGRIRDLYRALPTLRPEARATPQLNPGGGWVSRLCFEPAVGGAALGEMMAPEIQAGRLRVLLRTKAVAAETRGDRVESVLLANLDSGERLRARFAIVLDATELGDLLPLVGAEYVSGAEGQAETGEPHARPDGPDPECVQSFTYPFAVEFVPDGDFRGPEPPGYAENRARQPYTFDHIYYDDRGVVTYRMFETGERASGPFWTYRRLIDAALFTAGNHGGAAHDVAMINWPGNDFRGGNLIDRPPGEALAALQAARDLSLGFLHWLQTEAPRDDGGAGYPELRLRPDVMGVPAAGPALTKFPYIRESRRIRARHTIREAEIAALTNPGARARSFPDSVGVGSYMIDIHPNDRETKIPPQAARPFQIPLGALLPMRLTNLIAAAKNIGTTHITNGAYRLHPVEWNIGESAGLLAAFCLREGLSPAGVADRHLRRFQAELVGRGVSLTWFPDVPDGHPAFPAVQLLGTWGVWPGEPERLEFGPEAPMALEAAQALLSRAGALAGSVPQPVPARSLDGAPGPSRIGGNLRRSRRSGRGFATPSAVQDATGRAFGTPAARLMPRAEWARLILQAVSS